MPVTELNPPKPLTQLQGISDLTVIADIRPGLIPDIFESRSYAWRLTQVLQLLDSARRARRESDVMPSPFADVVARLREVHFFRFAVLPPGDKLLLNVTFDGGWETYIRLIWGPLGSMLDLIFCHCSDYPLAATSTFEEYVSWIRKHEIPSQFFYADSPGTVADRSYLSRLENQWRAGGHKAGADLSTARLALDSDRSALPSQAAVLNALSSLRALYGLNPYFGMPGSSLHGNVLLRFAQEFLSDLRDWYSRGLLDPGQQFDAVRPFFENERGWLLRPRARAPERRDRLLPLKPASLQAGILDSLKAPAGAFARGALVLTRVVDANAARAWLASSVISRGDITELSPQEVVCTVAITYPGLRALEVHDGHLESLPTEFRQGMEARAGVLGDFRGNHPRQWTKPVSWNAGAAGSKLPIDLDLVHVIVQLRTAEDVTEQNGDREPLLPRLNTWISAHLAGSGLQVLAVEPTWSRPIKNGEPSGRDHFNYVDGVSQPSVTPSTASAFWDDAVKAGEVVLGCVNDRGDGPVVDSTGNVTSASPAWLDLCTFIVVRKIAQDVNAFTAVIDKAAAGIAAPLAAAQELVRSKLMGRCTDGTPLVAQRGSGYNDFDFRDDSDGAQCPFSSHVRRTNPRAGSAGGRPPRIVRRGMSYGSSAGGVGQRGVIFMAYNASIAEQFEVIQRWLTGGNSSGVSSSSPDPFLGVPRLGERGVFCFVHGDKVIRVDLGDQPLCKLQWGLYALTPSIRFLQELDGLRVDPAPSQTPRQPLASADPRQSLKADFEDDLRREQAWKNVRESSGVKKTDSTVMVGAYGAANAVLNDDGSTYSVSGYGKRMAETVGLSPFGEDADVAGTGHNRPWVKDVKKAIADAVSERDAYAAAFTYVAGYLKKRIAIATGFGMPLANVDLVDLGVHLIARLCEAWFGVKSVESVETAQAHDDIVVVGAIDPSAKPVRCPGHFLSIARYIFSAYPNAVVGALAGANAAVAPGGAPDAHAGALRAAVQRWLSQSTATSSPVTQAVLDAMAGESHADKSGTVANVMLGLPATFLGSWVKVISMAVRNRSLWQLQFDLTNRLQSAQYTTDSVPPYDAAAGVLRKALILKMAANPVADGIWRTAQKPTLLGDVSIAQGDTVWLGLGAALMDKPGDAAAAEDLLFGGSPDKAPHACPGRDLAISALVGGVAALLLAGEWSGTPSPTALALKVPPVTV